jgi:TPR repeat protein
MLRIFFASIGILLAIVDAPVAAAADNPSCAQYSADIDALLAKDAYADATDTLAKMDVFCRIAKQLKSVDGTSEVNAAAQKIFAWADAHKNGDAFGKLALALMSNFSDDYTTILALERGAALNDEYSALRLGDKYYDGDKPFQIKKDRARAAELYTIATANGHFGFAMARLAEMYINGDGVLQDYSDAIKLIKSGIALQEFDAMSLYGRAWRDGKGLDINLANAYMWFSLAIERKNRTQNQSILSTDENDESERDKIASKLDKNTLLKAQAIAKQCLASAYKDCGD